MLRDVGISAGNEGFGYYIQLTTGGVDRTVKMAGWRWGGCQDRRMEEREREEAQVARVRGGCQGEIKVQKEGFRFVGWRVWVWVWCRCRCR